MFSLRPRHSSRWIFNLLLDQHGNPLSGLSGAGLLLGLLVTVSPLNAGFRVELEEPAMSISPPERGVRSDGLLPRYVACQQRPPKLRRLESPNENYRQVTRAVSSKDQDTLDVAGSAGTCDECCKTGIVVAVLRIEQFKSRR